MAPAEAKRFEGIVGQGPVKGQHESVRETHPPGGRTGADQQRSAVHRAAGRPGDGLGSRGAPALDPPADSHVPPEPPGRPASPARVVPNFVDVAHKVVGVGSVGTRCWIVLLRGRDDGDPLFLQLKEAQPSVLEPYSTKSRSVNRATRGRGTAPDAGRERHHARMDPHRGPRRRGARLLRASALGLEAVAQRRTDVAGLELYGEMCGWTLARAHARSGDRIAIASYLGRVDRLRPNRRRLRIAYADLNERDHVALGRRSIRPDQGGGGQVGLPPAARAVRHVTPTGPTAEEESLRCVSLAASPRSGPILLYLAGADADRELVEAL